MKEKFLIFIAVIFLITILIGLNAVSYVQKEEKPDSESKPNRSSYNVGATGTRAFYDLLNETGRNVTRWQEPPSALLRYELNSPGTFVVIGKTLREFEQKEIEDLLMWVGGGGRLVIIDRDPPEEFLQTTLFWKLSNKPGNEPSFLVDPSNVFEMTGDIEAAKPTQPTIFTEKVVAVQPSGFASSVSFERLKNADSGTKLKTERPAPDAKQRSEGSGVGVGEPPPIVSQKPETEPVNRAEPPTKKQNADQDIFASPTPMEIKPMITPTPARFEEPEEITSPVIHLANSEKNLLIEYRFDSGSIVYLTDPFIVSNAGINLVDNAQLGINLLASFDGIIAFDEYHQGFGKNNNLLLAYFEGTPVIAFALQLLLLIALVFFAQSKRFARAVPAKEPNRLSKLEYVSAMAQLQQRTNSYDLAIENIYKEFRRRAARLVGADNFTISRLDLAKLIAERIDNNLEEIDMLMYKCEDIIHGEPTNKKEVLGLIGELREIENKLGLKRANRARSGK